MLGALCEVVNRAVGHDRNHILDSATVLALKVNTGLNRHDMAPLKLVIVGHYARKSRSLVDIHTYTVTEVKGDIAGMIYDETSYEVKVKVSDTGKTLKFGSTFK